jgi:hypothetical protein
VPPPQEAVLDAQVFLQFMYASVIEVKGSCFFIYG